MEVLILILKSFRSLATYYFSKYKERTSKKNLYDKILFDKIDKIINAQEMIEIIEQSGTGYLPLNTYAKADALIHFNNTPLNKFNDVKIQKSFTEFSALFVELSSLYSLSSYAEYVTPTEL
jgi:hypothetical protein